ncbi:MFS transporter [Bradyrhizobium sp. U87765 SZCCT0131]|uniref:MFS transporter n=1 Tax=unclassified Bradyrhizobium TaxID=2631580 RepID=UPI001BAB194E|nr:MULTISPECIES: MFS transporter [unclassified Bradyrhizobium]MBR1222799.1 MFS transporter [Bradyrhizobium sp. U87765 SZCCT0131]MBR1265120.1 MFS transporter [Bradyrhizobium sp. U87765 SZCCT0134]MBR1303101.1 MFS transporter [Bradyrhizobium sp. U87765 SZCCT0110]MBR1318707.1 MFS transporter [Bradyrhizobium sp. U87765 SZCCT0109]MBR1347030.1 MFS transporter [Bradyrhizobium sp. U87765 SZCCT0048]
MDNRLERRVMRKVSWRIVPFVMLLYFVAYIDRVNIGFAALTMNKDLGFTSAVFGFGAGIFFWGYFLFEVPSNILLDKVGARIWIARVMITWGLVSGAMAFVWSPASFYALRFLLGAAEAGFFPGIILYLSYWFPARRRAAVTSLFMAAAPLSVVLGSPVSSALLEMHGLGGLRGWQWLFIIEALPAVLLGFVVLAFMTDRPEKAHWLGDDERAWLVHAMAAERAGAVGASHGSIWRGLADIRVLALALVYFGTSAGLYTLGIWAPQIIKSFGLSNLEVGLLNAVPPTVAVVAMYLWSWHSDRTAERTWHVVLPCLVAAFGLLLAGVSGTVLAVVAALTLVNVGISAAKPPLWSMPTLFLAGPAAATGIATINSIGNLGGFAGPAMIGWIKDQTGSYAGGLYFVGGLLMLSAVLTLVLSRSLLRPAATNVVKA